MFSDFRLLGQASFRNLWLAGLLSMIGSQVSKVGLLIYLFQTRDEVMSLALLVVLESLPGALVAPFAGAVIDRFDKRKVMILADIGRAGLMAAVLLYPTLWTIFLMAALHSVMTAFFQPAKAAALPLVVRKEELSEANGVDQSASNLMLVVGPVLGAYLLTGFGLEVTLLVDLATFLISAVLLLGVHLRPIAGGDAEGQGESSTWREIVDGWQYLGQHRVARQLAVLLFVSLFCTGTWMPLAPFFIRDFLGGSDELLGWQIGLFGWGSVLGGLLASRISRRFGQGRVLLLAMAGEALCMVLYSQVSWIAGSLLVIFVWGIFVTLILVPFYSILQEVLEERFLGRVFAVIRQSESCGLVVAMGGAIFLQQALGSPSVFLLGGLLYLSVVVLASRGPGGRELLAVR